MHPETEAEKVIVERNRIVQITKDMNRISPERAYGEFIGLAKFSKLGAEILKMEYKRASFDKGYIIQNIYINGN